MGGLYVEAVLDPETSQLLRNAPISVYAGDGSGDLATVYADADLTVERPQPIQTDNSGMLSFYAGAGYYELAREGGTPVKIQVVDVPIDYGTAVDVQLMQRITESFSFEEKCYISGALAPINVIDSNTVLEDLTTSQTIVYSGSTDVTLTLPTVCWPNTQFVLVQTGTGKIITAATAPATRANYSSHTKTAGPNAVAFVVNVAGPEEPEYILSGNTA